MGTSDLVERRPALSIKLITFKSKICQQWEYGASENDLLPSESTPLTAKAA